MMKVNKEEIKKQYRKVYIKYLGKKPSAYENFLAMLDETYPYWDELQKIETEHPELKEEFKQIQKEENIAYEVRNSTLEGSEKQIAWAEAIKYNIRQVFDQAISHFDELQDIRKHEAKTLVRERWGRIYDAKRAADIIDLFGHIHFSGDAAQDFGKICAVYKTSVPTTEEQKEILGK